MQLNLTKWTMAATAALVLSACASSGNPTNKPATGSNAQKNNAPVTTNVKFDSYQEVAYQCQTGRVLALYGIKDNTVAGVQVVHDGVQSPLLLRTNNPKYNEFSSSGRHITWTQNLAAPSQVKTVDARGLTRLVVGENQDLGIGAVVEGCKIDQNMMSRIGNMSDEAKVKWLGGR